MKIDITRDVITAAMKVHSELGPGVLESAYETCLAYELTKRGFEMERQKVLPIKYDGIEIDCGYRVDLIVNDNVILELKAVAQVLPVHQAQLLIYLKLSGKPPGLLINFHVVHLRDGITRMVNNFAEAER
ncbi:MAG TPA: GxxExxY protein [Kiritimatiellia bacterium]|jgi:GxxExxY protein